MLSGQQVRRDPVVKGPWSLPVVSAEQGLPVAPLRSLL